MLRYALYAMGGGLLLTSVSFGLFFSGFRSTAVFVLTPGIDLVEKLQPGCFGVPHGDIKAFAANALIYSLVIWIALFAVKFFRSQ